MFQNLSGANGLEDTHFAKIKIPQQHIFYSWQHNVSAIFVTIG